MDVPGARRLSKLSEAAYISNDELNAHGSWLRAVVDTFALDPGELIDPCADDYSDDRLYVRPFLRLADGYRVILPLDLAITIRFHLLRFASQEGQLEEMGERWREASLRRFKRLLPPASSLAELERSPLMDRYLVQIDDKRDVHVIVATDPLVDWQREVWGSYDTRATLERIHDLMSPVARKRYSSAEELLHLVITDSPGRGAFWGVPNVENADPMLIARADDLEVLLHQEPDGLLGLLLFAQAIDNRPGQSMSTDILDEYSAYVDRQKSFYFSDEKPANFTTFQTGGGLVPRLKFSSETDRHGVVLPTPNGRIVEVQRRYEQDAQEISITTPNSRYIGCVVEFDDKIVFVTIDPPDAELGGVALDLMDCVAYWVRECAILAGAKASADKIELILALSDPQSWKKVSGWSTTEPGVRIVQSPSGYTIEFTETFVALLQERTNSAERELVAELLTNLFDIAGADLASTLQAIAPTGSKRMVNVFRQDRSPDMLDKRLPRPLTGHDQVDAQLLDQLGEWLRSSTGGGFSIGALDNKDGVRALNAAVAHLFNHLEAEISAYDPVKLLGFLVAQNESLVHSAKLSAVILSSRLACFGEQSHTVAQLVQERKDAAAAHRANRFLIEYVAAQPPTGTREMSVLDYYRILCVAGEITERATISDFLHYELADFQISILESGRLGVSREQLVLKAMETYASNAGTRAVRDALDGEVRRSNDGFDFADFVVRSDLPMRAEFGFTLAELREVCGGLLDIATADQVTRINRSTAVRKIAGERGMSEDSVNAVLSGMTLKQRPAFLDIGPDAWPWRFNRDMSYIRRPLVLQGDQLVFGFRSVYKLGVYWTDMLISGRLQGRAKTIEMQQFISEARGKVNDGFARSVATHLQLLGMATRVSVKKVGKHRIVDSTGQDLGDIDILAADPKTRTIVAVEAKDFEIARTPAEIANELEKLFLGRKGKKSTIELHARRLDWLSRHVEDAIESLGQECRADDWRIVAAVVTSDPLITPLVRSSSIPVIPFEDLTLDSLGVSSMD